MVKGDVKIAGEAQLSIENPLKNNEFEQTRKFLLNSYHSDIQNHAGLLIAIIIGSLTLISRFDSFFSNSQKPATGIVFWLLICIIFGVSFYVIVRLFYWTHLVNVMLGIRIAEVETLFNKRNKSVKSDVPFPLKMQRAAYQRLKEKKSEKTAPLTLKISMMDGKSLFLSIFVTSGIIFILILVVQKVLQ